MLPIVQFLASQGLSILGNAILAKGKDVVEEKLGVKIPDDPAKLTPELLAQLKIKEIDHEEFLVEAAQRKAETELAETQAYLKDTQDARAMQIEALRQQDIFSKRFIYWFAIGWSVFAGIYIFTISMIQVPKDSLRFVDTVLGFLLGTVVSTILNFFFGTSRSSKAKDDTLAEAVRMARGSEK